MKEEEGSKEDKGEERRGGDEGGGERKEARGEGRGTGGLRGMCCLGEKRKQQHNTPVTQTIIHPLPFDLRIKHCSQQRARFVGISRTFPHALKCIQREA